MGEHCSLSRSSPFPLSPSLPFSDRSDVFVCVCVSVCVWVTSFCDSTEHKAQCSADALMRLDVPTLL
jgi:hypothetical protein